jgi:hypothetical protein
MFGAAACSKNDQATTQPAKPADAKSSSGSVLTAPVDYIGAAARAQQNATKTVVSVGLEQAIKLFYGQEGRFPTNLTELVPSYIPTVPALPRYMKYSYDPKSGTVKVLSE